MPAHPDAPLREASREAAGRYWGMAAALHTLAIGLALTFLPTAVADESYW